MRQSFNRERFFIRWRSSKKVPDFCVLVLFAVIAFFEMAHQFIQRSVHNLPQFFLGVCVIPFQNHVSRMQKLERQKWALFAERIIF